MADETLKMLGKLAPAGAQRDAVHIAVVPVVAEIALAPGQPVGLLPDGRVPHERATNFFSCSC